MASLGLHGEHFDSMVVWLFGYQNNRQYTSQQHHPYTMQTHNHMYYLLARKLSGGMGLRTDKEGYLKALT